MSVRATELIDGCTRFVDRLFRLATDDQLPRRDDLRDEDLEIRRLVHHAIVKVTEGFDRWAYNTSVAALMELLNALSKWSRDGDGANREVFNEAMDVMLRLLAPMAPHISAELYEGLHGAGVHVHEATWPVADPKLLVAETETMIVQVNGKIRAKLEVDIDIDETRARDLALNDAAVVAALAGAEPTRVIVKVPRMVNIVL
jgi:leucyl-tRNA synthetase